MSLGFTESRVGVLAAIERMGIASCAYSSGDIWAERCDCKYGVADALRWPTVSERGNGCPELRSLHGVIEAMTDEEWAIVVLRAGGVPSGVLAGADDIGARLHGAKSALGQIVAQAERALERLGGAA